MGGRGVESLQVLLSSLRVVAQKVQKALGRIGRWADPSQALVNKREHDVQGRCADVQAPGGLHYTPLELTLPPMQPWCEDRLKLRV